MKKTIIYGTGHIARLVSNMALRAGFEVAGFTEASDFIYGSKSLGLPVFDFDNCQVFYPPTSFNICMALGPDHSTPASSVFSDITKAGYSMPNVISSGANLDNEVKMGYNNIFFEASILEQDIVLKDNNILRPNVFVGTESQIGSHNFIAPCARIGCHVTIGNSCQIGMGAIIGDGATIEDGSKIGPGQIIEAKALTNKS